MNKLIPFFILLLSFSVFGQKTKPCSANLLKADISGFSLGASKDSISTIFNNPEWKAQADGSEYLKQTDFRDKNRFASINSLEFEIYEDELYKLTVTYDTSPIYTNMDMETFAKDLSKSWQISEKWQTLPIAVFIQCRERTVGINIRKILTIRNNLVAEKIAGKEKSPKP